MNKLVSVETAAAMIRAGAPLAIAGPQAALDQLPAGTWIAGTIPYFMTPDGGVVVRDDRVFVTDLPEGASVKVAAYREKELAAIVSNAPDNGFSLTIIPAGCEAHRTFAHDAAGYDGAFVRPTVGWIAGVPLEEIGRTTPKVYLGTGPHRYEDRAVVAHVALPADRMVDVEIVNIFEPESGDVLEFDETAFSVETCLVNGKRARFADYVRERGLDHGRLPLVGDFAGARINVSLQKVDEQRGRVDLYAPVFPGVRYHFARPVADYAKAFRQRLDGVDANGIVMGCNCVLNFVYGELEGKAIGGIAGPVTFGEIAYQLLNQTMATIRVV